MRRAKVDSFGLNSEQKDTAAANGRVARRVGKPADRHLAFLTLLCLTNALALPSLSSIPPSLSFLCLPLRQFRLPASILLHLGIHALVLSATPAFITPVPLAGAPHLSNIARSGYPSSYEATLGVRNPLIHRFATSLNTLWEYGSRIASLSHRLEPVPFSTVAPFCTRRLFRSQVVAISLLVTIPYCTSRSTRHLFINTCSACFR